MIHVSHLTRRFGDLMALDDVSFDAGKAEIVGILGLNGAGKTTLMRVLAGYLPATSGSAAIAGFDVLRQSMEVRRRIGYLPESVPLYREHRVVEMLWFQARLHGMKRAETKKRIGEVLERVGLTDRRRELIGNLSRGLRQRAGLAVALLPQPEVLILDEPTSGLDPLQRIEVRGLVRELAERHTVLVSSHILPEIEATCGRVVILHKGKIAADGTPEELVRTLLHEAHVRVEAVVGADVATAVRLLKAIRGVREVRELGRVGIHHAFEVLCDEDLREDVGALAGSRGWSLRELSWRRPTLEQIFSRIALEGMDEVEPREERVVVSPAKNDGALHVLGDGSAAPKVVYNLNPFDMGAGRDLGKPKAVEGNVPSAAEQRAKEAGGGS
jgi:ABC-2 type transport system ATP-binding protein